MSFDIVVLRLSPDAGLVPDLSEVGDVLSLGSLLDVRAALDATFPAIDWSSNHFALYRATEGFALEFSVPNKSEPTSLHVTLHFGADLKAWDAAGSPAFDSLFRRLYEHYQWQSFAASDNSSLLLEG